jgi:hypothetical protein
MDTLILYACIFKCKILNMREINVENIIKNASPQLFQITINLIDKELQELKTIKNFPLSWIEYRIKIRNIIEKYSDNYNYTYNYRFLDRYVF